jgi:protein YibB
MSDITIVTAFFDIGRSNWNKTIHNVETPHYIPRSTELYFSYFENLSKMKNDMIIFCDEQNVNRIENIRKNNAPESNTTVISTNFQETVKNMKPTIEKIQRQPEYYKFVDDPRMPEYWNADYVLVNYMKTDFVNHAYDNAIIKTNLAAWLDFGYVRNPEMLPDTLLWEYDFDSDKMHYFIKRPMDFGRPIFDIVRTNSVYIMGCHIVGGKDPWLKHKHMNMRSMGSLLDCGLVDDDQTILLMNYRANPKMFDLHKIDIQNENWKEWNVVMKNFNRR